MKTDKVVIIKGQKFDSITGLPIYDATAKTIPRKIGSTALHTIAKKSLNQSVNIARKVGHTMDIARSKSISHFAPKPNNPTIKPNTSKKPQVNVGPTNHPIMARVEKARLAMRQSTNKPVNTKSSKTIKEEAIAAAFKKVAYKTPKEKPIGKKTHKYLSISSISIFIILIVGYLIYLYMPSFSVKVASIQSGINATYPEFIPNGYSLSGPVSFSDGEVIINFHANTGDKGFTIKQSKSSWDSSAVKAKAEKDSGGEISTTSERGLTIFSYDNNAIWVNGGILYTISGDAPLSGDQIRRIATSL